MVLFVSLCKNVHHYILEGSMWRQKRNKQSWLSCWPVSVTGIENVSSVVSCNALRLLVKLGVGMLNSDRVTPELSFRQSFRSPFSFLWYVFYCCIDIWYSLLRCNISITLVICRSVSCNVSEETFLLYRFFFCSFLFYF